MALVGFPSGRLPAEFGEWLTIPEDTFPDAQPDPAAPVEAFPTAAVVDLDLLAAAIRRRFGRPEYATGEGAENETGGPYWGPPAVDDPEPDSAPQQPISSDAYPAKNSPRTHARRSPKLRNSK